MTEKYEFVIDASRRKLFNWKELFAYKELFYFFTWRDIKIRYKQTVLGFLWAILQPLMMMIVFTVFGEAVKISTQNMPRPVFVFSGLIIWMIFSAGLTNASNSMINNAMIIKKIYFPRLIIPVSSILVALFDFLITFILFFVILAIYDQNVAASAWWAWPSAIVITVVGTLGLGTLLASLNVKYRDFRYVLPFIVQILLFLSPVIYPATLSSQSWLRYPLATSPVYAALELFRMPLSGATPDTLLMTISLSSCFLLLIAGIIYFRRTEAFFADLS